MALSLNLLVSVLAAFVAVSHQQCSEDSHLVTVDPKKVVTLQNSVSNGKTASSDWPLVIFRNGSTAYSGAFFEFRDLDVRKHMFVATSIFLRLVPEVVGEVKDTSTPMFIDLYHNEILWESGVTFDTAPDVAHMHLLKHIQLGADNEQTPFLTALYTSGLPKMPSPDEDHHLTIDFVNKTEAEAFSYFVETRYGFPSDLSVSFEHQSISLLFCKPGPDPNLDEATKQEIPKRLSRVAVAAIIGCSLAFGVGLAGFVAFLLVRTKRLKVSIA